jgi:hypothetical protein
MTLFECGDRARIPWAPSQASDVGSIPIARPINPVDAVGFTGFPSLKRSIKCCILDADGRELAHLFSIGREETLRPSSTSVSRQSQ